MPTPAALSTAVLTSNSLGDRCRQLAQGPNKSSQFSRDRRQGSRSTESGRELTVTPMQALLRAPGELNERRRQARLPLSKGALDARAMPGMVRRLAQDMTEEGVAGLGDRPSMDRLAA